MANTITTINMGLPVPVTGVDPGPDYANNINLCFSKIDQHTHIAGSGVPIPPSGLNINSDLPMNGNDLITLKSSRYQAQVSALPGVSPDLGCTYVAGNELYYNDLAGNQVKLTNNGSVAGASGTIGGLVSPASASFSNVTSTFTWQSNTNTPAKMDMGSLIVRDNVANGNGITVSAPLALGSSYALVLPSLPPAQQIMTLDAAGNMAAPYTVDNSTIVISSNVMQVATVPNGTITPIKRSSLNYSKSSSCGSFSTNSTTDVLITNLSVSLTTVGRPIMLLLQNDGTILGTLSGEWSGSLSLYKNASPYVQFLYNVNSVSGGVGLPASLLNYIDFNTVGAPGTYTYSMYVRIVYGPAQLYNVVLVAWEM